MNNQDMDFTIERLGECRFPSPMARGQFTGDGERILYHVTLPELMTYLNAGNDPPALELAGPREKIFFDPPTLACGIVTCGGLCPGINNVIRAVTLSLHHQIGRAHV